MSEREAECHIFDDVSGGIDELKKSHKKDPEEGNRTGSDIKISLDKEGCKYWKVYL